MAIKDRVYLDRSRPYYKGNLHLHTNRSDGSLDPAATVEKFRSAGYDFISITDHDVYTRTTEFNDDKFVVLPGTERGGLNKIPNKDPGYHFGAIDDPSAQPVKERYKDNEKFPVPLPWTGDDAPQNLINELRDHGNLVIFNHPEWHLTLFDDMVKYDGFFAIEIYNYATEWTPATSYGTAYWDHALQNGKRVFAVAADDSHGHNDNLAIKDYGGGWVKVQAESLSVEGIVAALKSGAYYSSSGPEIYDLRVENGRLKVECSPCKYIMFKAFPQRGPFIANFRTGELITSRSVELQEDMKYIRVECIDEKGEVAWSNPIFLEDLLEK